MKLSEPLMIWIPVNPLQPLRFAAVLPLLTVILFPTPCLGQNGRPWGRLPASVGFPSYSITDQPEFLLLMSCIYAVHGVFND